MWNTFKYSLLTLFKERSVVIWALAFPLILATLFNVMFSGLDEAAEFKPIPTAIIQDANYESAESFKQTIESLSEEGEDQMLDACYVTDEAEAISLLEDESVTGYYVTDTDGNPSLYVASSNKISTTLSVNQTILKDILDNYTRAQASIENLLENNPAAFADSTITEVFSEPHSYTTEISVVANDASGSVRYFYSLLGFSAIIAGTIGMIAITRTQANLSALGARRAVGATSRAKTLIATLLGSWFLSFACLFIAFCYMRFILDINFGGRDLACIFALAIASLMTTALGSAIGSIPKVGEGVKSGILTGLSCLLALTAGLYGTSSQQLADDLTRTVPLLQIINPSKQVADLFYSLYFYDTYDQFFTTLGILLATALVLFFIAAIFMRRQRYASI